MADFAPGAVILANLTKQCRVTLDLCRHLANSKDMCHIWFLPIHSNTWKHDVIHKTRST